MGISISVAPTADSRTAERISSVTFTSPLRIYLGEKGSGPKIVSLGKVKFKSSRKERSVPSGKISVRLSGVGIASSMEDRFRLSLSN